METNPKVSIIISTYQRPLDLKTAIQSVVDQTFPDWELIVVDDHSTQDPKDVVEGFKDDRIKYVRLPKNSGTQAKPKNTGILLSHGEYIGFLDDDNTFRPDHLAVLVNELDRNKDVDVVYGDRWMNYEEDPSKNYIGIYHDPDSELLMQRNYIDTSDFLVRRQALFDIGGWDERHKRMLDWNLVVRLDKDGKKFLRVSKIITDYFVKKGGQLSHKVPDDDEWFILHMPGGVRIQGGHDVEIKLPFLGAIQQPTIGIFTITWERLGYTKSSFDSLWKTAGYDFEHWVIDNGSKDGTVEWLKEYSEMHPGKVHLLFNEDNKGISIASNRVLKEIRDSGKNYDILGKFDNDAMCLTSGWLAKMVEIYKANHRLALSCYISGLKDNAGGVPRMVYGKIRGEFLGMTEHLGGICCFTNANIRLAFQLDERETLHTADDLMFSKYIRQRGYQMAYMENYYINHGTKGTEAQKLDYPEYFKRREFEKTHIYEKV